VRDIAGGRVWSGDNALGIGLIDTYGGLKTAIAIAADKAGVALLRSRLLHLFVFLHHDSQFRTGHGFADADVERRDETPRNPSVARSPPSPGNCHPTRL